MSDHLAGVKENSCVLIDGGAPGVNQLVSWIWLAVTYIVPSRPSEKVSVFKAVYIDKRELKCACVGGDSNVPLGFISLTENLMMVAMALWMIAAPSALSMAH